MRLYKWISPALVIVLLLGVTLNSDSFIVENEGGNYYMNSAVDRLDRISFDSSESDEKDTLDIDSPSYKIVKTAFNEIGEAGGEKYWSYFGFNGWSAWCCTFVSWCADQCGYIESGLIPKFTSVAEGLRMFQARNEWMSRNEVPTPGSIIFFDLIDENNEFYRDGYADHVGIVASVKDGYIYCIEGNYRNTVQETMYEIGCPNIYGYGVPKYK